MGLQNMVLVYDACFDIQGVQDTMSKLKTLWRTAG